MWWLLTIANQFARLQPFISRIDRFALVPLWIFFAPSPFTRDLDLLYRDANSAGKLGGWHLATTQRRALRHIVWHPSCRTDKALIDICADLLQSVALNRHLDPTTLVSYTVLEHFVASLPSGPDAVRRQFIIVRSDGYRFPDGLEVLLMSSFSSLQRP
jgi:hypothetical protein